MAGRARIKDVALAAGVSTATVSRALSNPERVEKSTRDRVLKAVRATGYRINAAARDLRSRRARAILVLVPNLANTFFSRIIASITEAAETEGLAVQVADSRGDPARLAALAHDGRADGIVLLDGSLDAEMVRSWTLPVVLLCEWNPDYGLSGIGTDNAEAARTAVAHLAGLGHRSLLHVAGPAGNDIAEARSEGFLAACAALNLQGTVVPGDFTMASGEAAVASWAEDRCATALFCASDECAIGAIGALRRLGLNVPSDISVVGFDDIDFAARFIPALTTLHQPRAAFGREAAERMIALLRLEDEADMFRILMPSELVIRESTAAPPGVAVRGAQGSA
ncbi:MAG: LacI family DNA-binding transcriptional regulator [Pseudomonadota bacterium]